MTGERLRSPIYYVGGKGNMVAKLLPFIPKHRAYVEPFGGGASLLFAKEPSPVEVYNDIDEALVSFFRVLRDPKKFAKFYHLATLTPYSRAEYDFCRKTWQGVEDEVERAYRWFVMQRQSFGGTGGSSWGFTVSASWRNMAGAVSRWLTCLKELPEVAKRMMRVQVECLDFRKIYETYDTPETLFYTDPPYVLETFKNQLFYKHMLSDKDHEDLVDILLKLKGMAIVSGYYHEIYKPLEEAWWKRHDFSTASYVAGRTKTSGIKGKGLAIKRAPRTECVWICPKTQERLANPAGLFGAEGKEEYTND